MLRRICSCSVSTLSIVTLVISISYLGAYLKSSHEMCDTYFSQTVFCIGFGLLVLSIIGLIGSCCRVTWMLWLYLCIISVCIIVLLVLSIIMLVAIRKGGSDRDDNHYYRLGDFSYLLQGFVSDRGQWSDAKKCVETNSRVCYGFEFSFDYDDITLMKYFPLEWGCCKPPLHCGLEYQNDTKIWNVPKLGLLSSDLDCAAWGNNYSRQCYDCDTCRVGILMKVHKHFSGLLAVNVFLLIFLVGNLSIAACAFKTNQSADRYMRYRQEMVRKACDPSYSPANMT